MFLPVRSAGMLSGVGPAVPGKVIGSANDRDEAAMGDSTRAGRSVPGGCRPGHVTFVQQPLTEGTQATSPNTVARRGPADSLDRSANAAVQPSITAVRISAAPSLPHDWAATPSASGPTIVPTSPNVR